MRELNNSEYSELINKLLIFLKQYRISQSSVSDRINYYSLSKVKNSLRYPQIIIEKQSRKELFVIILKSYNLRYDYESEQFLGIEGEFLGDHKDSEIIFYVIYYFSLAKQIIGKGFVTIKEKKWTTIDFNDPNHTSSIWKGTFEVVESFTFLSLEKKGNTTPVKAFYSFFSGTIKYGRPILIGTYSSIKRDGSPTTGTVILEKVNTKEEGINKIKEETNPKIFSYLRNKNFTVESITPTTIDDLPKLSLSSQLVGKYACYWPFKNDRICKSIIEIENTGTVRANFENQLYEGSVDYSHNNSINISMQNAKSFKALKKNDIQAYLNINNYDRNYGMIAGVMITPNLFSVPASFPVLFIESNKIVSKKLIESYFNKMEGQLFEAPGPLELISLFTIL